MFAFAATALFPSNVQAGRAPQAGLPTGANDADDAYTITTTVKIAQPYDLRAMNDEFQTAWLLKEEGGVGTFEVVYRPLHQQQITANPHWRQDDAKMLEYLRPRPAANWDEGLRQQILKDLRADGIDPDTLDDKTLVEQVSAWAMRRSEGNNQFGLWMVEFDHGKPQVAPALRQAFIREEPQGMSESAIFDRELYGKGMYLNKTHGACTSSSTYLATILRAVGIPTRIILTIPACDYNDPTQIKTLLSAIRHHRTQRALYFAARSMSEMQGFVNHVFNEVWIGGKWVRLNYNRLGQPIVDRYYEGLMTHIYTANDISEVPFATTWGARYGIKAGPKLSSINPYQMLTASDNVAPGVPFDNPPLPDVPQITIATVIAVVKPGDPSLPSDIILPAKNDAVFRIKEWIDEDDYHQLRDFAAQAGSTFILRAAGKPDLQATLSGTKISTGRGFQGFGVQLRGKLEPGVVYQILPDNAGHVRQWRIADGLVWR
jgi:hypothetical protein